MGHRDQLPHQVQRALAVLDRAADGQAVGDSDIRHALISTGDLVVTPFTGQELRLGRGVGARS